jgi:GNAT superfamily N-acetyltransferase
MPRSPALRIETHPLTPERWRDFAALMRSAYYTRHCWCMWPRLATDYRARSDAANRRAMKKVVDSAAGPPGVLVYVDGEPAGWCAVAPRDAYPKLDRSHVTAAVDNTPVWSIVCFYVPKPMRGRGLSRTLLTAVVKLAAQHGAAVVEAYPVDGKGDPFHGVATVFRDAGFREVARRKENRPLMRYKVDRRTRA